MNLLRRVASAYVDSYSACGYSFGARAISSVLSARKASKPGLKPLEDGEEYGDEDEVYASSYDQRAPYSVSHDIAPIDNADLSPAYFNKTPRERRLDEIRKITSMKKLNQMLGSIKPAHWTLKESELKESFIRGSGNGGQAINKTSSCVSLIHLPTGLRVKAQPTRSRQDNRIAARKILAQMLAELDTTSTRESREDILRARVALRKRRSMRKVNKGYGNKPDVGLIGAPPSEEDLEDEDGFEDEDEDEDELEDDEKEEGHEVAVALPKELKPVLSMADEKAMKMADKEVREGLKEARKLERKEKKEVKEERKRVKEEKAAAKAAKKRS